MDAFIQSDVHMRLWECLCAALKWGHHHRICGATNQGISLRFWSNLAPVMRAAADLRKRHVIKKCGRGDWWGYECPIWNVWSIPSPHFDLARTQKYKHLWQRSSRLQLITFGHFKSYFENRGFSVLTLEVYRVLPIRAWHLWPDGTGSVWTYVLT